MKVAVVFSGQLRHIKESSYNILKNLINLYDTDVYAHLWWDDSMIGKQIHHEFNDVFEDKDYVKEFIDIYRPKNIIIEKQIQFNLEHMQLDNKIGLNHDQAKAAFFRIKSQYYSLKVAYSLINNPLQYDYIIRMRTDSFISNPINLLNLPYPNLLYVQSGRCAGADRKYCDWFAIGDPTNIEKYCNFYDIYEKYFKDGIIHIHEFIDLAIKDLGISAIEYDFGVPISHLFYKDKK